MALPSQLSYCKITGRFLTATADGPDSDQLPDGVGLEGARITFTAQVSRIRVSDVPVTAFLQKVTVLTDKDGYLYNPGASLTDGYAAEADRCVYLVAGDDPDMDPHGWTYTYEITDSSYTSLAKGTINAFSGGVIDLGSVVEVPPSPGTSVLEWQAAVTDAQAAQAGAETARDETVSALTPISEELDGRLSSGSLSATFVKPISKSTSGPAQPVPWVNAVDMGAVADGVTDNTAAIQAALNSGRHVYLPPGRYQISGPLVMSTPGQRLEGAGGGTFLTLASLGDTSRATLRLAAGANCDVIQISAKTPGVEIRDIQIYGNRLYQSGASSGINVLDTPDDGSGNKTEQPKIEDVVIRDCYTDGVRIGNNAPSAYLRNVAVYNSGRDGIRMEYTDSRIINCEVGSCVGDGIGIHQWTAKVVGCDVWGNGSGITFYASGGRNGSVVACAVNGNKRNGIAMSDQGVTVVGCELHDNSQDAATTYHNVFVGADNCSITACNFGAQGGLTVASNIYIGSTYAGVEVAANVFQSGSASTFIAGPGASAVGSGPRTVHIPAVATPRASVGTWTLTAANADFFCARVSNSGSQNDYIEFDAFLDAGTWVMDIFTRDGTNGAIATVTIDGNPLSSYGGSVSTFDTYAASATSTRRSATGIAIASRRKVRVRVQATGKNASSSSYVINLNAIIFSRSA